MHTESKGSGDAYVNSIGLEQGIVRVVPHSEQWHGLFEEEKARIQAAIGDRVLDIQHVGSTSIPGIVAKPIIDVAIAVRDFDEVRICIEPLVRLGYEYRGEMGIPRRHFFTLGDPRTVHIHMNEITSADWQNQIRFRDALLLSLWFTATSSSTTADATLVS